MKKIPLYVQIIIALILAAIVGVILGTFRPPQLPPPALNLKFNEFKSLVDHIALPCTLILKALRTMATPLIFLAILNVLITAEIPSRSGRKLSILLVTNTVVAIAIGLFVANTLHPGVAGALGKVTSDPTGAKKGQLDPFGLIADLIPDSVVKPLVDNNVLSLIFVALAFGIVLRGIKTEQIKQGQQYYLPIEQGIGVLFEAVIKILHWIIALVPIAVFGIVAQTIAVKGFEPFKVLGSFILAVIAGLLLQATYYLMRVQLGSWISPLKFLQGNSAALSTAFSTASSTVAMPVTFEGLKKMGFRESSASLGALVGSNFNNDGTALYEAMSALFIAQVVGINLSLTEQVIVMLTSVVASVGAAGIPEAGLVTMTLVFGAVNLPTQYIAILVTVDWFLDRCRTAVNVMGDMTVTALIDGKQRQHRDETIDLDNLDGADSIK
jgi:Na+/H+-dicarboxylate symporter